MGGWGGELRYGRGAGRPKNGTQLNSWSGSPGQCTYRVVPPVVLSGIRRPGAAGRAGQAWRSTDPPLKIARKLSSRALSYQSSLRLMDAAISAALPARIVIVPISNV